MLCVHLYTGRGQDALLTKARRDATVYDRKGLRSITSDAAITSLSNNSTVDNDEARPGRRGILRMTPASLRSVQLGTTTLHSDCIKGALAFVCFSFWLRVLDKAEYSAFESTLNSSIVSCRDTGCC